jgi:cytolysin-activating lysine-acyltransferase
MGPSEAVDEQFTALGYLHFLAAYCPLHSKMSSKWLSKLFIPAVNSKCVRFFRNEQQQVCAALIWARLNEETVDRMVHQNEPPNPADWTTGGALWFLDILAPFNHGKMVARHIARQPPPEPFYFARLNEKGQIRRIVRADATADSPDRLKSRLVASSEQGQN